jgi:hypothetical protein
VAAGAVLSIGILTDTVANLLPINITQVNYTKTDESIVSSNTYLQDIVSDIQSTSDHLSQSALTIEKINEINPYFGIDKVKTFNSIPYYLPSGNQNLFEYYKYINSEGKINTSGVFISPFISAANNKSLFHVCKGEGKNSITIGCDIGTTTIDGKLYLANDSETVQVDCQSDQIIITTTGGYQAGKNIISPYGTDLTNIGAGLTIEDIKTANPYIGINEYYTLGSTDQIPFAKDEKFFKYYRRDRGYSIIDFGVVVQAYTNQHTSNLFNINKGVNEIYIGFFENNYSSTTVIGGELTIKNSGGIRLIANGNETKLKPYSNYLSIQSSYNSDYTTDIILARGLRTSVTDNEVVFHKPGDAITDNSSPNQVKLRFGMDLTNIDYTPAIPEDLNTFTLNRQTSGTDNSVFNYYRNTNISQIGVIVGTNDNSDVIFQIAKDIDYVRIGTLYYKWSGKVSIGGGELSVYGKDGINNNNNNKICTLSTDDNNFNIKKNENNKITILYGTDLTNLETRLTTLQSGSGSGSNNLITFHQSIIDNTVVYNTNNVLYSLIMSDMQFQSPIKINVGDNVYPKTTHTLLTAYYTSYIDSNSAVF